MGFAAALLRRPSAGLAAGLRTHLERQPIDDALAARQHDAYAATLDRCGVATKVLPALAGHPDAVFVEDALLAFPGVFVLTRPGASERAGEPDSLAPHLPGDRPVVRLASGRLDGGDVLTVRRRVFVGLSSRTDKEGALALQRALTPYGYIVETVTVAGSLHLKTAMTAIGDVTIIHNPEWVTPPTGFRAIACDPAEPFASNVLWVNGKVLAQANAPRTVEILRRYGVDVVPVDVSELAKAEAGLTCMSVLIPPPAQD